MNTENVTSTFNDLSLPAPLLKSIEKMGFTSPTPIQEKAIPTILSGSDAISLAETGSGKTAAYLIPVLAQILAEPSKQVLILAPTRELATQISDVVKELTRFCSRIKFALVIGGAPMFKQIRNLKANPSIIVATPGRLVDHIRHKSVNLKNVTHFILDEADRMFDMGFAPQVNDVVKQIPKERQTLLFSATFPDEVRTLAQKVLRNPVEIEVRKNNLPPKVIVQKMIPITMASKNDRTLDLINAASGSVIVFTRTKNRTSRLTRYLEEYGVKVTQLHGDRSQGQRNKSIYGFKSGEFRVMVATDIAARGLDVSEISDVINYDIPMTVEDYVHRIGRTGRAGQQGQASTLVSPEELRDWTYIARKMGLPLPEGADKKAHGGPAGRPTHSGRPAHGGRPARGGGNRRRDDGQNQERSEKRGKGGGGAWGKSSGKKNPKGNGRFTRFGGGKSKGGQGSKRSGGNSRSEQRAW